MWDLQPPPGQPGSRQRPHPAGEEAGDVPRPQVSAGHQESLRRGCGHLPSGFHQVVTHVHVSRQGQTQTEEGQRQAGERGGGGVGEEREGSQNSQDATIYEESSNRWRKHSNEMINHSQVIRIISSADCGSGSPLPCLHLKVKKD